MRLNIKLLLPVLLGFFLLGIIVQTYWVPKYIKSGQDEFHRNQIEILKSLDPGIIKYMLSGDLAALYSSMLHLQKIHKNKWISIEFMTPEGQVVYPLPNKSKPSPRQGMQIKHYIRDLDEDYGTITIQANWKRYEQVILGSVTYYEAVALLLFGGVMAIGAYWQSLWITSPIIRLRHIAGNMSKGEFNNQLPKISNDEIGELTNAFSIMGHDLKSTQIKLREALNKTVDREIRQRAILNSVEDGIITINSKGQIESVNTAFNSMFIIRQHQIIGKNISELFSQKSLTEISTDMLNFESLTGRTLELESRKSDGSIFDVEFTLVSMSIHEKTLYMGVIRDVTEQKQAARVKEDFISTVSHELRTPLTAIKGSLSLLLNLPPEQAKSQIESLLEMANRNVKRLGQLIDDLLDISKLESDNYEIRPQIFPATDFINEAIELNHGYAEQFNSHIVAYSSSENSYLNTDRDRLMQVLANILSNAIKFSPENSAISINTSINSNMLSISVTDKGPGIQEDFKDKIFEKFTQHDSGNTRKVSSTGLGLNISKILIERMNGNIDFHNEPDGGATFTISLPIHTI